MSDQDTRKAESAIQNDEPQENNYFETFEADDLSGSSVFDTEEPSDLPLFPFDQPRSIKLKNGTVHNFNIPTLNQEKRMHAIQRTVIVTSPAIVNGQNPRMIKVDYSKSQIAYYQDIIASVIGYAMEDGDDPTQVLEAQKIIREEPIEGTDKTRPIKLASLIPITDQRAAIGRLYSGKIEMVKPDLKEGQKEIVVLNSRRFLTAKHELGIEQNDDGSFTAPEFRMLYKFNEPGSGHLSKWEVGCFDGFTLNNPKGGSREERTYNVEACTRLFDSMIESIEGGSVGGSEVDVKNADHLAAIPASIKVQIISIVMNDVTTSSGN